MPIIKKEKLIDRRNFLLSAMSRRVRSVSGLKRSRTDEQQIERIVDEAREADCKESILTGEESIIEGWG